MRCSSASSSSSAAVRVVGDDLIVVHACRLRTPPLSLPQDLHLTRRPLRFLPVK